MGVLNEGQFLYHGTTSDIKGGKILPAKVHGGHSHWGAAGAEWGEPSHDHAWVHPDENLAWSIAMDRSIHTANTNSDHETPRARVYAVKPNEQMTPGSGGVAGEFKAPHFDIAHPVDVMPGRQGTIPGVNWNNHVTTTSRFPDDEDANHPRNNSVLFGHDNSWGDHWNGPMRKAAQDEDIQRYMQRLDDRNIKPKFRPDPEQPLPGMMNERQFTRLGR